MKKYDTGAVRDTGGKGRMDLMPWSAIMRISKHMEKGSEDHGERNWEKGLPMHCFMDSAFRHMAKYMEGYTDEDHLCAAAWNLLCALWTEENKPEMQDIPTRPEYDRTVKHSDPEPEICEYYSCGRCNGTMERDLCTANGNRQNCSLKNS